MGEATKYIHPPMAVCYRHPGRETNVQCSNCGRSICPDCMTVTPVGMRCPECARERTRVKRISPDLHAGILHIAFNMFALYILGTLLEPGIGTPRFLAVYFVSLLAGSFGALVITPDSFTVGASGAVFGLMSAAFIIARHRGFEQLAGQIGFFIIINIFFTLGVGNISVGGHFGGLIGGALCALLIVLAERRARRPVELEILGMLALAVISVAGALAVA